MINIKGFRLTSITADMEVRPTMWVVKGYWVTDKNKIFDTFIFSNSSQMEYMGAHSFNPSPNMHRYTEMLMEEAHKTLEEFIKNNPEFGGDADSNDRD